MEIWRDGCDFVDTLYASYGKLIPIGEYASEMKESGKWGSTLDMCFISIVFGVNIVSISNTKGGLIPFSVFDYFRTLDTSCSYILDHAPTIWLYNHLYKQPFVASVVLNHFCSLWPVAHLPDPAYRGQLDHQNQKINKDKSHSSKKRKGADPNP